MWGPFIHNIDPIIGQVGCVYLWWYGLSYSLGFLGAFLWLRRARRGLAMGIDEVYSLSIWMACGILLGGRLVEVFFYEWPYYGAHPWHIPAIWLGGMSTHGILLGAVLAIGLFCRRTGRSFLAVADVLAIAGAYIMGMGRIGNFIDGQIVGSVTGVWWGVKFPDVENFRHPVVLYDGLKNLLLVPLLLALRRRRPPRGVVLGHFLLWYGFLRIFIDFFREYRTELLGLPPGQEFNAAMTFLGLGLIFRAYKRKKGKPDDELSAPAAGPQCSAAVRWAKRCAFGFLLILPMVIPSDWTQDVPKRYGKRHAGLKHSPLYPRIETGVETHPPEIPSDAAQDKSANFVRAGKSQERETGKPGS
jgi:phosphatidylglycerol:prolipoprotein diacylglycerol transferase